MPFQILCLSGGGFLGLYAAAVLAELEQEAGRPLASAFDLLAGTSIGGIIALGLAAEVPASRIKHAFEANGTNIFSRRPAPRSWLGKNWDVIRRAAFRAKYPDITPLRQTVETLVGSETTLGQLKHRVIVPAVNMTAGRPQVFKTPHHPDFRRDYRCKVVDVAAATSAAPTYFPLASVGDALFVDGGLYANSPDHIALHEAEHFLSIPTTDIHVLSIGTTTSRFSFSHTEGANLGILPWFRGGRLLNTIISAQQQVVDFMLRHKLENRYLRIDEFQSKEQEQDLALDVATPAAQRTILGLAETSIRRFVNNQTLQAMLRHEAPAGVFHYV